MLDRGHTTSHVNTRDLICAMHTAQYVSDAKYKTDHWKIKWKKGCICHNNNQIMNEIPATVRWGGGTEGAIFSNVLISPMILSSPYLFPQ